MKDLYARARLRPYESDKARLMAALAGSAADIEAARYVLLHQGRRQVYDRTHAALTDIGIARAALMLNDTPHWRRMSDFTHHLPREPETGSTGGWGWRIVAIGILIAGLLYWLPQRAEQPLDASGLTAVSNPDVRHVTAGILNVRGEPSSAGQILGQLRKYATVQVHTSGSESGWAEITYKDVTAYVAAEYLAEGDGWTAENADCFLAGTTRPYSGEILESSGARGEHVLTIHASASSDAIVKLKAPNGATVLSLYVRAGETASLDKVPDGQYRFEFATGESYGPFCGHFTVGMQAFTDDELEPFTKQYVTGGYYVTTLEYTLYDVVSGNFRPISIDPSAF